MASELGLDREEYWERELGPDPAPGDLFVDIPLLSRELGPLTHDDEYGRTRIYLPTIHDMAILYRTFTDCWWFLPVLTPDSFEAQENFENLLQGVLDEEIRGFFALPPLDPSSASLSKPALVYLRRPTIHRRKLMEEVPLERAATLTESALRRLEERFVYSLDP